MSRFGNIKPLTKAELDLFKDNYEITIENDLVIVKFRNRHHITAHPIDKDFSLSSFRKLKISKEAIKLWKENFYGKQTIFDIQNAINNLTIFYQTPTKEAVEKELQNEAERKD